MSYGWSEWAKVIRMDEADEPDKYGFTDKMHAIWDLVEDEKKLEDGGFTVTDADREFYNRYKSQYDWEKEQRGRPYKFPRYIVDVDAE